MAAETEKDNERANLTRQTRKKNLTHNTIMHHAKRLFEEKGIGNVTIEEIAEAADVSRSTFFSHFATVEALLTEIAGVAIEDILREKKESGKKGIQGIIVLMNKLIEDTCPYPHLTAELLSNGIMKSKGKSPFYYFENVIYNEIKAEGASGKMYTYKEQAALIMGAYFGLIYQRLIKGESFNRPEDIKRTMRKFINSFTGG